MFTVPFSGLTPTKKVWVSPSGSNSNDGSSAHPYKTIQYALDHATPGTAVMVKAGTYAENVEFHHSGTADKPIWLISADGVGKAHIKPGKSTTTATIEAFGEDYIVISGFDVSGGDRNTNGIAVTQGGTDFSNLTHHVVIKNNIVHDAVKDGIKVAQGDYVYVVNNRVHHVGDQGIDFVAVNNSVIARNEVTYVTGKAPALFAKGGSTNVLIADNYVAHVANDGIAVGGWTEGTKNMRPGYTGWQAKNVVVIDNHVEDVGKRPLVILGAQKSQIIHNYLESNPDYYYVVTIAPDNSSPPLNSKDTLFKNNTFDRSEHWLQVQPGQGGGLKLTGNRFDGVWDGDAGLGSESFPYTLPWQSTASTSQATLSTESTQDQSDSNDQSAATAKLADAADKEAASSTTVSDDAAESPAVANSSALSAHDSGPDPATPHAERSFVGTRLAIRDLFSDLDDGPTIFGVNSGPHAAHPTAPGAVHTAAPAATHGAVAAGIGHSIFRGQHEAEAPDVAAVEQQLQHG
jgi:Right handed beta helix region